MISSPTTQPDRDPRLRTRVITPDLISYIVKKIAHEISPEQIIVFGSYACGEANSSSDLDLFVIQNSNVSNRQVRRQIEYLLWGRQFGVDLIVRSPEEVKHNMAVQNPFYTHHVFGEGKVVYEQRG